MLEARRSPQGLPASVSSRSEQATSCPALEEIMAEKTFKCSVCGESFRGSTAEEVLDRAVKHAVDEHGMQDTAELREKFRSMVHEE